MFRRQLVLVSRRVFSWFYERITVVLRKSKGFWRGQQKKDRAKCDSSYISIDEPVATKLACKHAKNRRQATLSGSRTHFP